MSEPAIFRPALFRFIADLTAHNERGWFQANKPRYERDARQPALRFVVAFGPYLRRISPHFQADPRPVGGSLFRIHRDVRFSRDKSPYKDHIGIQFRHDAGRDAHAPGFYLHLQPRNCFAGVGLWRPDTASQSRIRAAIAGDSRRWLRALTDAGASGKFARYGEQLKRPPRGYDPADPLIDELRYKEWLLVAKLTQKEVTARDFPQQLAALFGETAPVMRFLCKALGLAF
jgi:uncharacterized protein (TIGR02453 family)